METMYTQKLEFTHTHAYTRVNTHSMQAHKLAPNPHLLPPGFTCMAFSDAHLEEKHLLHYSLLFQFPVGSGSQHR